MGVINTGPPLRITLTGDITNNVINNCSQKTTMHPGALTLIYMSSVFRDDAIQAATSSFGAEAAALLRRTLVA